MSCPLTGILVGTELIGQSRLLAPIIDKIFNVMDFYPFFTDIIAVFLLIIGGIGFCILFKEASNGKISKLSYLVFECFFISSTFVLEIFKVRPMGISIGLGFIFTAISLILCYEAIKNNNKKYFIISAIFVSLFVSLYESFAIVYVIGAIAIKAIEIIYVDSNKKFKEIFKEGMLFLIVLLVGIIMHYLIVTIVRKIFSIPINGKADKAIFYKKFGVEEGIRTLIDSIMVRYIINALGYLPVTYLMLSIIASIFIAVIYTTKRKNKVLLLLFFGMQFSLVAIPIFRGTALPYRTCQFGQLFTAIIFMLAFQSILDCGWKDIMKKVAIGVICLMLFYQVKDTYYYSYMDDVKSDIQVSDLRMLGNELLSKYDTSKPIYFIGDYDLPVNIEEVAKVKPNSLHEKVLNAYYKLGIQDESARYEYVTEVLNDTYIDWAIKAHYWDGKPGIELIKFFRYLGYDFHYGEDLEYFLKTYYYQSNKMPRWPQEGSIVENENCIIVNF